MKRKLLFIIFFILISCNSEDYNPRKNIEPQPDVKTPTSEIEIPTIENSFPAGSLNSYFSNALISDQLNNIDRANPIKITEFDAINNRIKTNYTNLDNLLIKATDNQSWFITQNSEASTVVEIVSINKNDGWITLGNTYTGILNTTIGAKVEFFNPFINYEIIKNKPLFDPYPISVIEGEFNYIQPGGIFEKSDGTYILLTPIVFGSHTKRSIYYATSTNLENWVFHNKKILGTSTIPFAKTDGNVFTTGNPLKLDNGNLLFLLGIEQPNKNYTSAYMIMDENLNIIQQPKKIMIPQWNELDQNSFPLSITKFNNQYRLLLHKRKPSFIDREIHELIFTDLFDALDLNKNIISSKIVHVGNLSNGYLKGKADDATYVTFNSQLYIIIGGEETYSNYLTSNNREYGLMRLDNGKWYHDARSPLIVNPVQLFNKYPIYSWAWDHSGGFISPIIKNNTMYLYMALGTDNPDYFIAGIKITL
ncbi:hypothetical protein [Flavobacterium ovatum]|uniref:hypothetical protein n=1 Tax=Flavobacterium ovatum TaxID=1928857 RepID=UPI00344D5574